MINRERHTGNYLLVALSTISLVLLSMPLTGKVQTFRAIAGYLFNPLMYSGSQAYERLAYLPENAARIISVDLELLKAMRQLREAELTFVEVESLRRENERLRVALGLKPASGRIIRWARILARDPVNWHQSLMVNAGSEEGIKRNASVLGLQGKKLGVVGRVIEVGLHVSKVLLITDELSAVAAYLPSTNWEGLVQGQGSFKLRMNYLPVEGKFSVGETIYTSPTSAAFPSNLPIGTVTQVFETDPFLSFQSIEIAPIVSASVLKEVMILDTEIEGAL